MNQTTHSDNNSILKARNNNTTGTNAKNINVISVNSHL
jgi:hypothetical protein